MTVRLREPQALSDTSMLTWDTDVVDVIDSAKVDVESLLCVAPHLRGRQRGWYAKQIAEIWQGTHVGDDEISCVLFVDSDGVQYLGLFTESTSDFRRKRLVGRVRGAKTPTARRSAKPHPETRNGRALARRRARQALFQLDVQPDKIAQFLERDGRGDAPKRRSCGSGSRSLESRVFMNVRKSSSRAFR